jgi:hypothetical protein
MALSRWKARSVSSSSKLIIDTALKPPPVVFVGAHRPAANRKRFASIIIERGRLQAQALTGSTPESGTSDTTIIPKEAGLTTRQRSGH